MAKRVQYVPDPRTCILLVVGIKDAHSKNSGIPMVPAVSIIPRVTVPDHIVYVSKHLPGERVLAAAYVVYCSLHALAVPPIHVSPDRDRLTSKRLGYSLRGDALKRHNPRGKRLTCIRLLNMRGKPGNLVDIESTRIRNLHPWHWHTQSLPSAVSRYTS